MRPVPHVEGPSGTAPPRRRRQNASCSRRRVAIGGLLSSVVLLAVALGAGAAVSAGSSALAAERARASHALGRPVSSKALGSFGWLTTSTPPASWLRLTVASGLGTLAVPPGYRPVAGDAGTTSVALIGSHGTYLGYLNAAPRQGGERLRGWAGFRLAHLRDDDAASAREHEAVEFVRTGRSIRSCVIDDYVTTVGRHGFHEVACLVITGSTGSVIVGATPSGDRAHTWRQLEQSVAAYPTP
jgi:hypothetical protein